MNASHPFNSVHKAGLMLVKVQRFFLFYLFLLLVVAMMLELLVRFFLKQSIFGLSDFIGFASVWLYAIGAALASYDRTHIKAEFVNVFARSTRFRNLCRFVSAVISTAMSVIFTKWSWDLCVYSVSVGEVTQAYPVPKVIFQSSFFVGGILMVIYFLWEAVDCFIDFRKNA
ncbi:MAG: TRAP transporter small permease [Desulfotignum sp.]|nr:TRAP transporter small permease [Desulfotignum sp.]MCF8113729.1 TRAP transporter small permease [Desulfotignum sp.]